MSNQVRNLPPGFRFKPTDDELINFYLKPKVMAQNLPCHSHIINQDIEVYSPDSTPWLLFNLDDPYSWVDSVTTAEKTIYVFTTLTKLAADSNNTTTSRIRCNTTKKAGCGTWKQRTKLIPIIDQGGNVIGGKRMLNFEIDMESGYDPEKGVYFKMHEYSLCGVNKSLGSDVVLCEITFDPRKKPFYKLATKTADQVSRRGRKPKNIKQNKEKLLEGRSTSTSNGGSMINGEIFQESTTNLNPESLVGVGNEDYIGVQNLDEYLKPESLVGVQNLNESGEGLGQCFDDQGDQDWFLDNLGGDDFLSAFIMEHAKSNSLGEPLEDGTISELGKRKYAEGIDSCQAKKICL